MNQNLDLSYENGVISVLDRETQRRWRTIKPCAALRLGSMEADHLDIDRGGDIYLKESKGKLRGKISTEKEGVTITVPLEILMEDGVLDIWVGEVKGLPEDIRLELEFPRCFAHLQAGAEGYLIIPIGMGALCDFSPSRSSRIITKQIYSGGQTGITMPLSGIISREHTWGCIVGTPYDCSIKTRVNTGKDHVYGQTPVWTFDRRLNYPREAHYFLLPGGDYVDAARRYREEMGRSGRWHSLRRKAKKNPILELTIGSLLGHRRLSYEKPTCDGNLDMDNSYGFFQTALKSGFDRVVVHNVLRGDPDTMSEASQYARSLSPGFRLSVYENYLDIFRPGEQPEKAGVKRYPEWDESLIARKADGSLRPNWRVKRKGKPDLWTYTVCPARRLKVARPQMERMSRILGRGSIYIDVEGAVPLFECFDRDHPVTRADDAQLRRELINAVKHIFGVVSTEALPQDFLAKEVDVGSYFSVFPYSGFGNSDSRIMPPLIPIPLHPLVWHGSILNQTGTGTTFYQSDPPHAALFAWLADTMDDKGRRIAYKLRNTGYAEMVNHEFLTEPRVIVGPDDAFHCDDVQKTEFSDGTTVIANFASIPYHWEGRKIPPMDFIIINRRVVLRLEHPIKASVGEEIEVILTVENTWDREISLDAIKIEGRGLIHSERPLMEADVSRLGIGERITESVSLKLPGESGKLWLVATIQVDDEEPWSVTELATCQVSSQTPMDCQMD